MNQTRRTELENKLVRIYDDSAEHHDRLTRFNKKDSSVTIHDISVVIKAMIKDGFSLNELKEINEYGIKAMLKDKEGRDILPVDLESVLTRTLELNHIIKKTLSQFRDSLKLINASTLQLSAFALKDREKQNHDLLTLLLDIKE